MVIHNTISEQVVYNGSKSAGPDQIPPYILKHRAHEIVPILQVIYSQSLHSGQLPSDWLMANVTLIIKREIVAVQPIIG